MYSRYITIQLKNEMIHEFPKAFEKEILPVLRKQKGFLDELILSTPGKTEVAAISLWENKDFAEVYNREFYPEVMKTLNKYIVGTPVMKTYEVQYATFPWFEKYIAVTA